MSLDKFVLRGFTGSLGSGEGKWVQTVPSAMSSHVTPHHRANYHGGTSFVMGGGGLRGRPAVAKENSQRDPDCCNDRYSFNAHDIRQRGTTRHTEGLRDSNQADSLNEWMNTKRGHQVVLGIAMYGIALFVLIFLLIALFGDDSGEGFYTAPAGLSRHARPMWER